MQQKVLLLLLGGFAMGLSGSPDRYFRIARLVGKEWGKLNKRALRRAVRTLYQSQLIEGKNNPDGSITMVLSKEGKRKALTYTVEHMKIKKVPVWDGKWRIIAFDIPEDQKKVREALRFHFRHIGLKEYQKSVFISPYPCEDEVDFLIEIHQARAYVRKVTAESIDNDLHFRIKFGLR